VGKRRGDPVLDAERGRDDCGTRFPTTAQN
jgi:hypothetical protein